MIIKLAEKKYGKDLAEGYKEPFRIYLRAKLLRVKYYK